ncbi:B12-binding domain-containing radical SAM protein [candidate division WOR-3 bacterium]|nr:B12-binding domain-containing radical SAM protein [candidate division WOR-3 bacterium]
MAKKNPFLKSAVNVGMICPGGNAATFSSLSLHYMKQELAEEPGVFADFLSEEKGVLKGFESGFDLGKFDVLAVTASWPGDFFSLRKILDATPPEKRRFRILCGGPGVLTAPHSFLGICDAVFFGDADYIFTDIVGDFLAEKTEMPWLIFAGEKRAPKIRFSKIGTGKMTLPGNSSSFGETGLVEISRGCPFSCRFCWLSGVRKNFQPRDTGEILRDVESFPKGKIGLVSAAFLSHPDITKIISVCPSVSPPSCRVDLVTPEILSLLAEKNVRALTLAPETCSEKLSIQIGKPFDKRKFFETVKFAGLKGIRKIKLYMMTGLPGASQDDAKETVETLFELAALTKIRIEASFSQFIPMPFSEFNSMPLAEGQCYSDEINTLKDGLKKCRIATRFSSDKTQKKIFDLIINSQKYVTWSN